MSEPRRTTFLPVLACQIVLMILGWLVPLPQALAGAQSPRLSREDEQRRIEAELKRMSQPEVRRERMLLDELNRAQERYHSRKDASARPDCESLLAKVLALPRPSAKAYSACAATASLLDRPDQAIEIVKKMIAEYPEEHLEGPVLPIKISGYYRIAALATRMGDVDEATRAYEAIIASADNGKSKEGFTALPYMCLADLFSRTPGKEQAAAERLQQVVEVMESINRDGRDRNDLLAIDLMKNWARYELARLEHGIETPGSALSTDVDGSGDSLLFAAAYSIISCPSQSELEQMAESDRPSVLRNLAGLLLVIDYAHRSNPFKMEKYLLHVAEGDSYFKTQAKAALDRTRDEMTKVRQKIPMLLSDLKQGDAKQREQAAFKLLHECGSEGAQALSNAQEDPNKYVRYMAVCTLAAQFVDRSVKPRFDVILEALSDNDPNVRRRAASAVGSRTCIDMDSAKIIALVGLMRDRSSEELVSGLSSILSSTRPEILDVVMPKLVALLNHGDRQVRDKVLRLFDRIASSLGRRFEIEDEAGQVRIIAVLKQMGPAIPQVVPMLTTYAQYDNANVRSAANDALSSLPHTGTNGSTDTRGQ